MASVAGPVPFTAATQKITLTGPQETLLGTLWSRWLDNLLERPILGDKWAQETIENVDYDFDNMNVGVSLGTWICLRARILDQWTTDFLTTNANSTTTVLHIACGLDSRCLRMHFGHGVRWVDLDLPDVVTLREQLVPAPEGDYTLMAGSATSPRDWLDKIPNDRPTMIVIEGLIGYLTEADIRQMVVEVVRRFTPAGGRLAFDCIGREAIKSFKGSNLVKSTGTKLFCGIDDPQELVEWAPGLKLVNDERPVDLKGYGDAAKVAKIVAGIPSESFICDGGRTLLYEF